MAGPSAYMPYPPPPMSVPGVSMGYPAWPSTAGPAPETKAGAWITILGGLMLGISGFLPWFTASILGGTISRNGMQLGQGDSFSIDGLIVILLGAATLLIGISRLSGFPVPRWIQRSPIVTGLAGALVVGSDIPSLNNLVNTVQSQSQLATASLGYGVYIGMAGAAVAVIGGLMLRRAAASAVASSYGAYPTAPPRG